MSCSIGVIVLKDVRLPVRKFASPETIFGSGSIELVGQHASNLSRRRVLVVSDQGVREAGWTGVVERSLERSGLEHASFDGVSINPRIEDVMSGSRRYLDENCDLIVAVGGGSPMDCAKCIGIVATGGSDIRELEGADAVHIPGPPLICVPTTAGSSADVSPFAVITDAERGRKMVIISRLLIPELSVIDPDTTMTMDASLTVSTGMDALVHAIESYVSNASSPLTDLFAWEAARLITENLPAVHHRPADVGARENMMLASLYAGLAFSNASVGLLHAMAHGLGGLYGSIHGEALSTLLEQVIRFNYPCSRERYYELERAMFGTAGGLESLIDRLNGMMEELGAGGRPGRCGLRREDIPRLSENAVRDPCLATNPRPAKRKDIEVLYERAL